MALLSRIGPEKVLGTHIYAGHGTKTSPVFLPADGEASCSLPQKQKGRL